MPIIMLTGYGEISDAVQAIKNGAYDYLLKPISVERVLDIIRQALKESYVKQELRLTDASTDFQLSLRETMGSSAQIQKIMLEVERVAATDFSVLILGETGVGKELVARSVHAQSHRAQGKFVAIDCGSIPETLMESELFGHEKGAFTGADRAKSGKLEMASGGTLFLDEIGNLTLGMQSKLLRVLQEKNFYRVGGVNPIKTDMRVIAATNQYLPDYISKGTFRGDLYHRLGEYVICVPALRDRQEDILFLVKRFMEITNYELNKNVTGLSQEAQTLLQVYEWPGNVRELRNVIRRAVLMADKVIQPEHLEFLKPKEENHPQKQEPEMPLPDEAADAYCLTAELGKQSFKAIVHKSTSSVERAVLIQVLKMTNGNKAQAARLLQIDYKTIHTKLKQYQITSEENKDK